MIALRAQRTFMAFPGTREPTSWMLSTMAMNALSETSFGLSSMPMYFPLNLARAFMPSPLTRLAAARETVTSFEKIPILTGCNEDIRFRGDREMFFWEALWKETKYQLDALQNIGLIRGGHAEYILISPAFFKPRISALPHDNIEEPALRVGFLPSALTCRVLVSCASIDLRWWQGITCPEVQPMGQDNVKSLHTSRACSTNSRAEFPWPAPVLVN